MGWGKDWNNMNKEQKQSESKTYHFLTDKEPLKYLGTKELAEEASKLLVQDNNLVFICDNCGLIYSPGLSGFQELIDAARRDGWKITFHVGKDGYAMACPTCKT